MSSPADIVQDLDALGSALGVDARGVEGDSSLSQPLVPLEDNLGQMKEEQNSPQSYRTLHIYPS